MDDDDVDVAEPEPDTVGAASGTAKCHYCGERIRQSDDGWVHVGTGFVECGDPDDTVCVACLKAPAVSGGICTACAAEIEALERSESDRP